MPGPAWSLPDAQPVLRGGRYDALALREMVVRFPLDGPAGGYVSVQPVHEGVPVGEPILRVLSAEDLASIPGVESAFYAWLAGLVGVPTQATYDPQAVADAVTKVSAALVA